MNNLLIALLACGILTGAGCGIRKEKAEQKRRDLAQQHWEEAASALAEKHGASKAWSAELPDRGFLRQPFSIDLAKALVRSNSQPVLLMLALDDVAERDGEVWAHFSAHRFEKHYFQIGVSLKCSPELARRLMGMHGGILEEHAVIARITKVSRARLALEAVQDGEDTNIEVNYYPTMFIASGDCLDVIERERSKN